MTFAVVAGAAVLLSQEYSYHIYAPKDSISDISLDCDGDCVLRIAEINPAGDETEVVLAAEKPGPWKNIFWIRGFLRNTSFLKIDQQQLLKI